jgi:hypothetical protein
MAIVAADWTITRATKVIAYTGNVHTGVNPSYATVIEFHRWLQGLADDAVATPASSDQLDVTNIDPSRRSTDNIITLINGYTISQATSEHLYDGSVIQGTSGSDIWDGIVNFGNKGVLIQLHQNSDPDGSVVTDDWWNYSLGGTHTGATHATIMTDSALSTALTNRGLGADDLIGFTLYNTTDGSHGIITDNDTGTITVGGGLFGGTDNDFDTSDVYKVGIGVNRAVTSGISHRWMQKVRTGGTDVDLRRLLGTNRRFGYTYGEFSINATARGNNVLALSDSSDLNNATSETTVSAFTDVFIDRTVSTATVNGVNSTGQAVLNVSDGTQFTDGDFIMWAGENSEYKIVSIATNALTLNRNLVVATTGGEAVYDLNIGYKSIDVDNNTVNENYYAVWDRGAQTINGFYEYTKYQVSDGSTEQVYGLNGELFRGITHEITVDTPTGNFDAVEAVSWTGSGTGTGQMLAINSETAATKMWIQLLTGVAPVDGDEIVGANSAATVLVNVTVTDRSISKPFVGASTGSALIGSYGLALQTADLSSADKVTDLTNTVISPPNNVTNIVAGLADGEDRVLVAPWDGSTTDTNGDPAITKTQLSLSGNLTADDITSVVVQETIPSDTPSIGYIRVTDNNGFERRLHYSSWATSTFTVDTTDGNEDFLSVNASNGNDVWIAYVDALYDSTDTNGPGGQNSTDRFTSVQSSSRNLVVVVRDGGGTPIKQFISSWTQTSSNQTINAIRTTDV